MSRTWSPVMPALAILISCSWSRSFAGQAELATFRADSEQNWRRPTVTLEGEVSAGGRNLGGLSVELVSPQGGVSATTELKLGGSFEFRGISPGDYTLWVTDGRGRVLHEQFVAAAGMSARVSIRLPEEAAVLNGEPRAISVRELSHKVPKKAVTEYNRGVGDLKKSRFTSALGHLEAALGVDPEFADAHFNAGFAYFKLEQYRQSLEHFQKAVDLAPGSRPANESLCVLLLKLRRFEDAGVAADRMLRRGDRSPVAHYTAAVNLLVHGGSRSRALDHLRFAADEIPRGRLLLAQTLAETGRRTDAARELQTYLSSPDADSRRPELETWLAELER